MGVVTLEEFRVELSHALGGKVSDNTLLNLWINQAYFETANIAWRHALRSSTTENTADGTRTISLPTDAMEIISLADLDSKRRLVQISLSTYHSKDRTTDGEPRYYAREANDIVLWPTPDDQYEIEILYIKQPSRLTAEGDTSILPHFLDRAISLFSARNGLLALGEDEKATLRHQSAEAYIRSQMDELDHGEEAISAGIDVARSFDDLTKMSTDVPR